MQETLLNLIIWFTGAVVVLLALVVALGLLAWAIRHLAGRCAKGLASIVRFETARYWVQRMEREGLTIAQKEYRRMVRERQPKTPEDFERLGAEVGWDKEQPEKGV